MRELLLLFLERFREFEFVEGRKGNSRPVCLPLFAKGIIFEKCE